MFICQGTNQDTFIGKGTTLKDSFEDYQSEGGDDDATDCIFFEGEEVEVEIKIEKKEVVKSICKTPVK
jgi:hypothetical protein